MENLSGRNSDIGLLVVLSIQARCPLAAGCDHLCLLVVTMQEGEIILQLVSDEMGGGDV